jgi:hypothetical protein
MINRTVRHSRTVAVALAVSIVAAALITAPSAQARSPIRDCGDIAAAGASAVTAQGVNCKSARAVARIVPARKACGPFPTSGGCTVRGFTCLVGQAGKELFLVSCQDARQQRFIRFEYGS